MPATARNSLAVWFVLFGVVGRPAWGGAMRRDGEAPNPAGAERPAAASGAGASDPADANERSTAHAPAAPARGPSPRGLRFQYRPVGIAPPAPETEAKPTAPAAPGTPAPEATTAPAGPAPASQPGSPDPAPGRENRPTTAPATPGPHAIVSTPLNGGTTSPGFGSSSSTFSPSGSAPASPSSGGGSLSGPGAPTLAVTNPGSFSSNSATASTPAGSTSGNPVPSSTSGGSTYGNSSSTSTSSSSTSSTSSGTSSLGGSTSSAATGTNISANTNASTNVASSAMASARMAGPITPPTPLADAAINLSAGPFSDPSGLTVGDARSWALSPLVTRLYGGTTPSATDQAAFASRVASTVEKTYSQAGVPIRVTTDPAVPAAHTINVVSGAQASINPNALGVAAVGYNGYTFIDQFTPAQNPTDLATAVGHNVAHELMHAFGVSDHPEDSGNAVDAATTTWSSLTDPNASFSQPAAKLLTTLDLDATGTMLASAPAGGPHVEGAQEFAPLASPVPEPTAIACWVAALGAFGLARRRLRG